MTCSLFPSFFINPVLNSANTIYSRCTVEYNELYICTWSSAWQNHSLLRILLNFFIEKLLVIHHTAKSKVQIISQVLLAHTAQKVCKVSMLMRTYPVGMKPVRVLLMPSDQTITTISMDFSTVFGFIIYNSLHLVNY